MLSDARCQGRDCRRRSRFQQAVRLRGITHRYNGVTTGLIAPALSAQDVTADSATMSAFCWWNGVEHCRGDACTFEDQQAEIQRGGVRLPR